MVRRPYANSFSNCWIYNMIRGAAVALIVVPCAIVWWPQWIVRDLVAAIRASRWVRCSARRCGITSA
jgi:hypothetical protein